MTFETLYKNLKALGHPVAYNHFNEKAPLPFLIFIDEGKGTFVADEKVWTKNTKIRLELYFEDKEKAIDLESRLEDLLDSLKLIWEDEETYFIPEEEMYQHNYYFSI